ncbi:MAG: efflux RND transporter periplasmic adaptor subunit [Methylomonas sp.]|jgi:membrane fusion protein (multidrug efflux system)|uniref:efflux RND transporter periplasmic adaptor subunit n=1 Tax=Methylomonas sp. TaxID=418 RepID=UPI0025E96CC8|nr:efflux RND transporter periplasmic adaptor subunit [Methylomonas sp.]MCK9606036.1 efflux RND transporter periplasmic adaptor subunit [Methylomonas sp.]
MHTKIRPKEILQQRNRRLKRLTLMIVLAGIISVGYWWLLKRGTVSTDDAFVTGHLIPLKAQTDGIVVEILTENTRYVQKGDVLVKLDGVHAQLTLQQAEAELGEIVRNLVSLTAKVETLKQRIIAKEAVLNQVRHDLDRFKAAAHDGAVSDQKVQNTQDKIRELEAVIRENQAEKISIEAQISGTTIDKHPAIEKAKSRVRAAFLNFQRRNVVAPASGYVAKRKVQVGDNVKPGTPLLAIVPLDDLWIDANFLETQVSGIRPGQTADIRVDAYGDELIYHGIVQGILPGTGSTFALLPTDNATGNFIHVAERVQVRIGLDPKELRDNPLQPGLSTVTRINTRETGSPLLSSSVAVAGDAYRTEIYAHELDGVELRLQRIIAANKL